MTETSTQQPDATPAVSPEPDAKTPATPTPEQSPAAAKPASRGRTPRPFATGFAALITALAIALAAHVATVLAFFAGNGAQATVLVQVSDYFVFSTLIAIVLLFVAGIFGVFKRWYFALAAGVVAGILAAVIGSTINVLAQGAAFSGAVVGYLVASLVNINLLFIVFVALGAVTFGRPVFRALFARQLKIVGTRYALVRIPSSTLANGTLTHLERSPIDTQLADKQWDDYVAALSAAGWQAVEIEAADDMADSVFVEDAVVIFDQTAVIASPGAESRRGEIEAVERGVAELGLAIERIDLPGTLDGGDVLKVGRTVYVGRGGRTNADGIRQLRAIAVKLGYRVVAVPVTKALHLKSTVTALPDGTVIGHPDLVDDPSVFDRFLPVPEASGAHVVVLADDTVLMAASAPKSAALMEDLGYRVVTVDISEFEKLEGCVTCLSVRIR